MIKTSNRIQIGKYIFKYVNECEINSTWDSFTDTCKIVLPKKLSLNGNIVNGKDSIFKIGDRVSIELGYDHRNNKLFSGYVSAVSNKLPITIECEDYFWIFKKVNVPAKSFKSVSLEGIVNYLMDYVKGSKYYPTEGIKVSYSMSVSNLGQFRIPTTTTPAQILDHLKSEYGVITFFRENVLHVGLAYVPALKVQKDFQIDGNMISDDLTFLNEEDYKVNIKAISISPDNKKTEIILKKIEETVTYNKDGSTTISHNNKTEIISEPEPDATVKTLHYHNVSKSDMKTLSENQIDNLMYSGFSGSFEAWGKPFVRHNDSVKLTDRKLPERNGTYLIKAVTYTYGMGGYRQSITIDRKIN